MKNKIYHSIFLLFLIVGQINVMVPRCDATSYEIKEMTPEIKAALDSRRDRFDLLRGFKEKGIIGEDNKGYVQLLSDNGEAKRIVDAENEDRRFIYEKIVEQNNLPKDALATVEKVFAQVQRDKANPGDKIQNDDGQWINK